MISIGNEGDDIKSTNYWATEHMSVGLCYLSGNAGTWRLLVPEACEGALREMRTGKSATIEPSLHDPRCWDRVRRRHSNPIFNRHRQAAERPPDVRRALPTGGLDRARQSARSAVHGAHMSQPQSTKRPCRPRDHVTAAGLLYPQAWPRIDEFRAGRGVDGLPQWPDWCFLPMAAYYAIVCADAGLATLPPHLVGDVGRLAALGAWRVTQGIYRFDPAVYDAVRETPLDRAIPCDVLYHLPEWCVYIDTPGLTCAGSTLHGVFAHLEWDANTQRTELRLLLDSEQALVPLSLHLGVWPLAEALDRVRQEALRISGAANMSPLQVNGAAFAQPGALDEFAAGLQPIMSLLLYLCSQAGEIGDDQYQPRNPTPKRTKRGWRLFAVDQPTTWEVGVRLGAALRGAYQAHRKDSCVVRRETGKE